MRNSIFILGMVIIAVLNYYYINHDLESSVSRALIIGVIAVAVFGMIRMFQKPRL